ncbi:MAG: FG-GAP-like repeat-containing protein, partial [Cyclobacteriaceae bacterium]
MRNHQNQLFSGTKSKYFKFKSRLEKNISSGRFDSLSRRKKNSLIRKIEKFRLRLENLSFSRSAAVAGSLAAGMALPNLASAQNPDYRRGSNALPLPLDARNVAIANIDGDSDLEIIVSTVSGGYIINGNDTDGFTATNPAELVEMTGEFEVGDVDGDGNLDLVYHDGIRFEAAINDGTGNFGAPTQLYMMSSPYTDFKLADFDSDGDQDILFVENTRGINHSLNNGSGTFSAFSYMGLGSQPLQSIELADLDGDGDMDLVAATYGNGSTNYAGRLPVFENSAGAGNIPVLGDGYSAVFNYYLGYTVQADNIEILDFDNDGDLDIFFNQAGTNTLYFAENNYVGSSIGMYFSTLGIPTVGNSVNTVTSFDFENDGNEDLLITNGGETSLFESDGVGFIKKNLNGTYGNMSQNFSDIVAGDIDVDGFPDIIGVNTATNYVYSDRAGAQGIAITYKEFSERTAPASQKIGDLIITDVDGNIMGGETIGFTTGDGSNDADNGSFSIVGSEIFVGASDLDHETQALFNILINVSGGGLSRDIPLVLRLEDTPETGAGTFESLAAVNNARMQNAILADLDGDGDNELLYKSSGGYSNILLEDDLTDNSGIVVADAGMFIVADFDNDGDLDIIGGEGYDLEVYYNDGAGNFSFGFRETLNGYIYDIAIADFDQDGDNDVAVATYNGGQAYRNNGDQTIIYFSSIAILSTYTHRVEVGDFDNDGLTDIVFGSYDDNYIFQNAGGGSFSQISSYYFYNTRKSEVADFDGDGDLDLLILDYDDINLLRGDGTGSFTEYNTGVANVNNNTDLVVGDMDADNDLDVAFIVDNQYGGEEVRVYLNDGSNYFSPGQDFPVEEADEYGFFRGLVLGDVDGDDDLDLIVSGGEYRQVLVNDNIAPYITGFTGRVIVDENTLSGTPLGQLIVTDPNGDAVSNIAFSSGTNDNDFFLMDGLGNLTLNADLDWEQMGSSLLMEILVEDDQGNSRIEQGKLKVRNLPEDGNGTFDTKGIPLFGSQDAYAFEPGDYDMDGDQDLFKSTYNEGRDLMDTGFPASIFQQNAGSFSDEPVQSISYTKYNMIFLDSDNDGDLDILAYGYDLIRTSNNDGEFSNNNSIISSGIDEVPNMIAGDFDRDGLLEVAVQFIDFSPKYETRVEIFEIQEGGEFTPDQAFQMNYNSGGILDAIGTATDIAVADFNGNGYDDLLVATEDGDDVLFAGSASGFSYSYTSVITEADNGFNKIEAGDFDGNGSPDIAILRFGPSNNDLFLDVHLNDGAGNLSLNQTIPLGGEYSGDIKLGDVDGDGSLDIVTASYSFGNYHTDIDIHINDGAGTFTLGQNIYNVGGEEFKLMDVDGDDDLDVVVRTDSNYKGGARKLIAYKNINVSPTAINLSVASFDEHLAPDTEVATLSVDDLNVGDTHVISLVTGDGSNDLHNSFFSINGNSLRITKDVRFETHPSLNFYLSVYDGYQTFEQAMVLTVNDVNVAPTGINLSMNSFDEGTPPGTQVSTLSAIDANTGDTHTFDFATGDGTNDADNGSFIINGDRLIITDETVFEAKSVYNIYVSATDIDNSVEQALVLTINDVDQIPTGILLSSTSFDEGLAPGSEIATISAIDPNIGDNHFFEFASGDGSNDADNGSFIINGDKLVITTETQFELKSIYNIYLTAIDDDGSVEQAFVLNVNDINQAPTGIQLSSSTFDEGTAPGTTIATLTAIDANVGDNHTFSLASGDGSNDADNASFSVVGNQLKVTVNSSFETQSSYNVYLSVADDQGSFEQAFVLTVNDINQAPTGIMLSSSAFDEGTVPGTVIATLTAVDANVGDTHTFSFASGDGSNDADNESFAIVGNQLKVTVNSSFETQPSYNVYLSVEDGEGSFEQAFVLTVNDINQA